MQNEKQRLLWQCRRGMLELDVILKLFLETQYDKLTNPQKELFQQLLQENDTELFVWLIGHEPAKAKYLDLIRLMTPHD